MNDITLIFNPVAGTEDVEERRVVIDAAIEASGLACEIRETTEEVGAGELSEAAVRDGARRIIVAGGDGSVVEAAEGVAGRGVALGVLPAGTANLLAHNAGIPSDGREAADLALTGEARPYDVGRANGKMFLIVVGMGADAEAVRDADRETKDRLGPLAYVLAAARRAMRPRVRYTVTTDGHRQVCHARTVLVANAGQLPGPAAFVPDADPRDGLLDVAIVRAPNLMDVLAVGRDMLLGRPPHPRRMEMRRGREIVIETPSPQPVQRDGNEDGAETRLEITVEPSALNLVHPPDGPSSATTEPEEAVRALWKPLAVILTLIALTGLLVARRKKR